MSALDPKVDAFLGRERRWRSEMTELRKIALSCKLTEELKWGTPCYALDGKNVVLIHGFKEYCAYLFFKGALLKDPRGILIIQTPNVQASRQIRFLQVKEIVKLKSTLKAYIQEAIEVEKAGLKVARKKPAEIPVPHEFRLRLDGSPALTKAFEGLTPGRQRGYLLHFGSAKQSKTRASRIEKHIPRILAGRGLDD
jgi:uncharacterized protein YdeI (YjbR/CyaY-like superfamily)